MILIHILVVLAALALLLVFVGLAAACARLRDWLFEVRTAAHARHRGRTVAEV